MKTWHSKFLRPNFSILYIRQGFFFSWRPQNIVEIWKIITGRLLYWYMSNKSGYRQNKIYRMIQREHLCFQYQLRPPLASLTATQRLLMDRSTFVNTAWGRRLHYSTRTRSRSRNVWGESTCWRTRRPSSSQICSIRLRSGLRNGQSKTSTPLTTTRGERPLAKNNPIPWGYHRSQTFSPCCCSR